MSITELFSNFAMLGAEWVMYVLIGCSVLSIAIIIERALYMRTIRGDFASFIQSLTQRLNSSEPIEKTAQWCGKQKSVEARVAAVGLGRANDNFRAIEESMAATMIATKIKLDRGLTVLATLGNNTPFIGLFGTILGIIQAFRQLAEAKSVGPEIVMASIAEALAATAVGLLVAIPAVIAYNIYGRIIKTKMANSDATARILMTYFARTKPEA
ncbi:MAG: MotA/TolQ/ExbB proton channel family protein [Deltaproteobacteria bacterium]|nr:MotA/TolQ/ExbB proton channel family protein [Deltaproteobacteria bacterium]